MPTSSSPNHLCEALAILASPSLSTTARNAAVTRLEKELHWAASYLHEEFESYFKGRSDAAELIRDAVQHLLIQASTGRSRFKGTCNGQARAWCDRVLRNFALTVVGKAQRRAKSERPLAAEDHSAPLDDQGVLHTLELCIDEAFRALPKTVRPQDVPTVTRAAQCLLEFRKGDTTDEQIARYALRTKDASLDEETEWRRSRDCIYQMRCRGAKALTRSLDALRKTGRFDESDLLMVHEHLLATRKRRAKA